jgi:hypothetical protein
LSRRSEFSDPARQIGQWHVDSTRQVARGLGKFLGLTHIDKDNGLAGREAALQFDYLDPCRGIHAPPAEQTGQKCCHGELLSDRPTRPRRRADFPTAPEISFRRRFDHQSTESPLACRRVYS